MSTRTLLIVAGVAAVAGGVWYYRHRMQTAREASRAERILATLRNNPQIVDVLRAEEQRRNAGANLWRAMNQQKA